MLYGVSEKDVALMHMISGRIYAMHLQMDK